MTPVQAIVFDLGNVLIFHDNALLFRRLGEQAGLEGEEVGRRLLSAPLWEAANRGRLDGEAIRREVCRALGVEIPKERFEALWSCHFTPNEPVFPMIDALVGKVRLLLLSNTNVLHRGYLLPRLPALRRFDHLLFSCDLDRVKPEPALFQLALERAGTTPAQTAFFDDLPDYVEAANALGLRGRLFTRAEALPAQLAELGIRI